MKRLIFSFLIALSIDPTTQAQPKPRSYQYDPPWNDPIKAGVSFTVFGIDNVPDLYGDINDPQLVVFMGGPVHGRG